MLGDKNNHLRVGNDFKDLPYNWDTIKTLLTKYKDRNNLILIWNLCNQTSEHWVLNRHKLATYTSYKL